MMALKSFAVNHIYIVHNRSNKRDNDILIKNLFDQVEFLKQKIKSRNHKNGS